MKNLFTTPPKSIIPIFVSSAILAACGGGQVNTDSESSNSQVNVENAKSLVASAYSSSELAAKLQQSAQLGAGVSRSRVDNMSVMQKSINDAMETSLTSMGEGGAEIENRKDLQVLDGNSEIPCMMAGSVTIMAKLSTPGLIVAGDSLDLSFDNCDNAWGVITNGGLSISVDAFSGDIFQGNFNYGVSVIAQQFSVSSGNESSLVEGDFSISLSKTDDTSSLNMRSQQFSVSDADRSLTLSAFAYALNIAGVSESFEQTVDGRLEGSDIEGSYTFENVQAFKGSVGQLPASGELLVSATNSSVKLIVLDSVNVQLDVDSDGDGSVDNSLFLTWDELLKNDVPPGTP